MITRLSNPSAKIPTALREPYGCLFGAVIETKGMLRELRVLFSDQDTVDLMKDTAEAFFARHQRLLVEHIILSIFRLTDKKESGSHKNLTLEQLLVQLDHDEHQKLLNDLHARWKTIGRLATHFRTYRNKLLGHLNLEYHLSPSTDLGNGITLASMQRLLDEITDYLTAFHLSFDGNEESANYPIRYGEAEDMLHYLTLGRNAEIESNAARDREIAADQLARR